MTIKSSIFAGMLLLLGAVTNANAMGVTLLPTSNVSGVSAGDIVRFDVVLDFAQDPTIGGGVNISYDATAFALVLIIDNRLGGAVSRPPDTGTPGLLESWAFALGIGLAEGTMGSVQLAVLAGIGNRSFIAVSEDTLGIGGPFISNTTLTTYPDGSLEFNGLNVTAVPVPATPWFLLPGLGALLGFGHAKRKKGSSLRITHSQPSAVNAEKPSRRRFGPFRRLTEVENA